MPHALSLSFSLALDLLAQAVLMGDEPGNPHPSAILDVRSDEKGLLIPSMTTAERDAVNDPFDGLIIYSITIGHLNVYDSVEDEWQVL
ncbi:MAG: hypothetical protein AAF433_06440 [Bacteroidota bacterium]